LLCLYILALILANKTPDFYKVKGAGIGDRASNEFMKNLRQLAKSHFGSDFSEMRVCKDTKHAFDFYIPRRRQCYRSCSELAQSCIGIRKDIFKCLLAKEDGLVINSLLFISKPGAMTRHDAPGSKRIRELVWRCFGVWVDILELLPGDAAERLIDRLKSNLPPELKAAGQGAQ
jgi:hypothetical protein